MTFNGLHDITPSLFFALCVKRTPWLENASELN
jgi:hypothetical protein